MLAEYLRKLEKALGNAFLRSVVKPVVTVAVALKTHEMYPGVSVFSGPCLRLGRRSNCCAAVLLVLFPMILPSTSMYCRAG